jgi:hypothetical protein
MFNIAVGRPSGSSAIRPRPAMPPPPPPLGLERPLSDRLH